MNVSQQCSDVKSKNFILKTLVLIDGFMIFMHFFSIHSTPPLHHLAVLFDLNKDATVSSWFSPSKMFLIGTVLFALGYFERKRVASRSQFLIVLGAAFIYLSMDEAAILHERLNRLIGSYSSPEWWFLERGVWIIVYATIGAAIAAMTYRSMIAVWHEHASSLRIIVCGFALQLTGCLGVEVFGYYYLDEDSSKTLVAAQVGVEEFLELLGVSVILYGVLTLSRRIVRLQTVA